MNRNWMRLSTAGLLAAALWITGCSDTSQPADRLLGPDVVSFSKESGQAKAAAAKSKVKAPKIKGKKNGKTYDWTAVVGNMPEPKNVKSEELVDGNKDVTLYNNGHYLFIPRGTVSEPTTFRIRAYKKVVDAELDLTEVAVELRAYTIDPATGEEIDAGADGFDGNKVYLGLTHTWAANFDPAGAAILWLKPTSGGFQGEPVKVVGSNATFLVAELLHFSDYIMAIP